MICSSPTPGAAPGQLWGKGDSESAREVGKEAAKSRSHTRGSYPPIAIASSAAAAVVASGGVALTLERSGGGSVALAAGGNTCDYGTGVKHTPILLLHFTYCSL
jgi:hypothetical protein